jgi:hypothetical protein
LTLAATIGMTGAWAQDTDEVAVTKTANNNEWTLTMPASDVELQVEYYENLNSAADLSALVANFAGKAASVAHTRSFTADVPSTICQPFAMTSISGGKVYSLLNVTYDQTEKAWVATMSIRELDNKWYTLDGRQLQGQPTAKGLYIQNGKKVMVK